jgi:hypothetical protein
VSEVANLKFANQLVDGIQDPCASFGDLRADHSAVRPLTSARDKP